MSFGGETGRYITKTVKLVVVASLLDTQYLRLDKLSRVGGGGDGRAGRAPLVLTAPSGDGRDKFDIFMCDNVTIQM